METSAETCWKLVEMKGREHVMGPKRGIEEMTPMVSFLAFVDSSIESATRRAVVTRRRRRLGFGGASAMGGI